ncbi:MAG: NAD(P)/FAD-dependent oxidoreductase [Coprobacillus sp.]|nr:NAD(P)/FAD-dependent oxidoreductase [Coprobacillus sp.]
MIKKDLVIIGGGSAGMGAALQANKLGIKSILIIEKEDTLGGILNQCIHTGFGLIEYKEELTGPEFLTRLEDKVKEEGIEYKLSSTVLSVSKDKVVTYSNSKEGVREVHAKAIIYAGGCYERNAGEIELGGKRISGIITAGQAQKYLNIYGYLVGKKIVILGSGDIGLIMARRFTLEGAKVICVAELSPYCNGLNRNVVQCLNDFDIPLYLSTTVKEVKGKDHVESVTLVSVDSKGTPIEGTEREIECDTLCLSVGLVPYLGPLNNLDLVKDKAGRIAVNQYKESSLPGLFICGNALHVHDIVDYVVEEAREAAKGAKAYLDNELSSQTETKITYGSNINYVVPQSVATPILTDFTLKFRVRSNLKDVSVYIYNNDTLISKTNYTALIPSQMVMINLKKDKLEEPINLSIKVEERK